MPTGTRRPLLAVSFFLWLHLRCVAAAHDQQSTARLQGREGGTSLIRRDRSPATLTSRRGPCEKGQYRHGNGQCKDCHTSCAECIAAGRGKCTSCKGNDVLDGRSCKKACPKKKFANETTKTCEPCSRPCQLCKGTATTCTGCFSNRFLDGTTCKATCPSGKYKSQHGRRCLLCNETENCIACQDGNGTCTRCKDELFLWNSKCLAACPQKSYPDEAKICQSCEAPCAACKGSATSCTLCESPKVLLDSDCKESCPLTHFSTANRICEPCADECKTCSGISSNCTSCKTPLVLSAGTCQEATTWTSPDWEQKKNTSTYDIGENTCQEWDCAAGSSCKNSVIEGVCFEGKVKGGDIQFDWTLTEPLKEDRKLRFIVDQFKCGNGLASTGLTQLHSYDAKGGELLCSYSMADQMSYDEFVLTACQDAKYLYFTTTACEGLPRFSSIAWVS